MIDMYLEEAVSDSDPFADPEAVAETAEVRRIVADLLNFLKPRERRIMELRFGLLDGEEHTLEEIGEEFSLTRERIRQIEANTLTTLRASPRLRSQRARLEGYRVKARD